jgi:hypothetical protein
MVRTSCSADALACAADSHNLTLARFRGAVPASHNPWVQDELVPAVGRFDTLAEKR